MAEFGHFPTEILSCITQGLDGFDVANMWFTGDSRLRRRMESGGVTRFKLMLRQERTRKWPKLISHFKRLEYLRLSPMRNHRIWFSDVDLIALPQSLKHLKLNFENSEFVLLGIPFVTHDLHPDPAFSPPVEAEMTLAPLPLAEHFNELQTLTLQGSCTLSHILVPLLPQSLLRLSLPHRLISANTMKCLPPNLTRLELPGLTKMSKSTKFPSGLTHLNLRTLNIVTPTLLNHIPAYVTELNLSSCESELSLLIDLLPPNLRSLSIDWNSTFTDSICERLPQTLRYLSIRYHSKLTKLDSFPPGLQSLLARDTVGVSDEEIQLLPPTMTKVNLRKAKVTSDCLKFLPENLRSLALRVKFEASPSPYRFMKTLRKLDCLEVDPNALVFAPRLIQIKCDSFLGTDLSVLKGLSQLRIIHIIDEITLTSHFVKSLPPALEELDVSGKNELEDPAVSRYLPRSLKTLRITGNESISDAFVAHLPPRLIELCLSHITSLSNHAISLLPRTLQLLVLNYVTQLTDESIKHLPPSMTDCRLERVTLLTNRCASLFPRHITRLYLDRCGLISNEAMPHFPRTLTSLDLIQNTLVNEECIPHLPPLLEFFRVKNASVTAKWDNKTSVTSSFIESLNEAPAKKSKKKVDEIIQ